MGRSAVTRWLPVKGNEVPQWKSKKQTARGAEREKRRKQKESKTRYTIEISNHAPGVPRRVPVEDELSNGVLFPRRNQYNKTGNTGTVPFFRILWNGDERNFHLESVSLFSFSFPSFCCRSGKKRERGFASAGSRERKEKRRGGQRGNPRCTTVSGCSSLRAGRVSFLVGGYFADARKIVPHPAHLEPRASPSPLFNRKRRCKPSAPQAFSPLVSSSFATPCLANHPIRRESRKFAPWESYRPRKSDWFSGREADPAFLENYRSCFARRTLWFFGCRWVSIALRYDAFNLVQLF